jgi:tetratricopeptide (TPR) repeat protein
MIHKKPFASALVIFGFLLLALTGIRTVSNPDIFTYIALGQAESVKADPLSYTMADQQWINMTPLYNELVHALWQAGGAGLITFVHTALVLVSFILLWRFGRNWGGPLSQGMALLLCAWLLLPVFTPGPYVFFMLFTALFITLLYQVRNFPVLAVSLLLLQILWTNMHPSFLFGPLLILFFAIENWQGARSVSRTVMITPLTARLFGLAAAAAAVTLFNPNLINLHRHVLANWITLTGTEGLEWISLFSSFFPQGFVGKLTLFALILGAGGLITLQKKLPAMITLLALIGAFLTVRSVGSLHFFAFLAFPFLILSFNAVSDYLTRTLTATLRVSNKTLHTGFSVIALILMLGSIGSLVTNRAYANLGSASAFGPGVDEGSFPVAAAGILARDDFPKQTLNTAHDGGYIALQNPDRRVFCDTRTSFYGQEFYRLLNRAMLGQPGAWKTILSEWNPHGVVLNGGWPDAGALANRLIASKAWKMVYFDGATIILVRALPDYETLINDPSIQQYGLSVLEKSRQNYIRQNKGLVKAGNPARLIGAGGLYLSLNRPKEAEKVYSLLVENNPAMAGAWLGLGQSLILQKQISRGITHIEKAAEITPRSGRVWMALFQAYRMKGDNVKAQRAADQLNKFFKEDKATVEQRETAEKSPEVESPQPLQDNSPSLPKELQ